MHTREELTALLEQVTEIAESMTVLQQNLLRLQRDMRASESSDLPEEERISRRSGAAVDPGLEFAAEKIGAVAMKLRRVGHEIAARPEMGQVM